MISTDLVGKIFICRKNWWIEPGIWEHDAQTPIVEFFSPYP